MNWKKAVVIYCRFYIYTFQKVLRKTTKIQNLDLLRNRDSHTRISRKQVLSGTDTEHCLMYGFTLFNVMDSCFSVGCIAFLRHTCCLAESSAFSRHCRILRRKIHDDLRLNVLKKFK